MRFNRKILQVVRIIMEFNNCTRKNTEPVKIISNTEY